MSEGIPGDLIIRTRNVLWILWRELVRSGSKEGSKELAKDTC